MRLMPPLRRSIYSAHVSISCAWDYKPEHVSSFPCWRFLIASSENGLRPSSILWCQTDALPFAFWSAYYRACLPWRHPFDRFDLDAPISLSDAVVYCSSIAVSIRTPDKLDHMPNIASGLIPFLCWWTDRAALDWRDKYRHLCLHRIETEID